MLLRNRADLIYTGSFIWKNAPTGRLIIRTKVYLFVPLISLLTALTQDRRFISALHILEAFIIIG